MVVQLKTRRPHAPSPHLHPALLSEGGREGGIGEDLLILTPAAALVPPPPLPPPPRPPDRHLALQKDKSNHLLSFMFSVSLYLSSLRITPNSLLVRPAGAVTSVQRAAHVRPPALAPCPAPHRGATGGLTLDRDAAGRDPDLGPSLGPHPDPDHHPHGFAVGSGEMFTGQLMF